MYGFGGNDDCGGSPSFHFVGGPGLAQVSGTGTRRRLSVGGTFRLNNPKMTR